MTYNDPTLIGRPGHTMGEWPGDLIVSEATAHAINTTAGATLFEPVWDPDLVNTYRNHPHQMLPTDIQIPLDTLRQQQQLGILPTPHTNHNNDWPEPAP